MSFIQQPHSLSPFQMFVFSAPPHTKPSQHPHLPPLGLVQDSPSPPRTPLCPDLWVSPHYSHCFCCFKPYFSVIRAIHVHYRKITGSNVGFNVKKSMELINRDPNVYLELRTTYVPTLHTKKDIRNLVGDIEGDVYTIQQFRNKNVLDPALEEVEVPNPHDLRKLAEEIMDNFDGHVKVKSAEFGEEIIK